LEKFDYSIRRKEEKESSKHYNVGNEESSIEVNHRSTRANVRRDRRASIPASGWSTVGEFEKDDGMLATVGGDGVVQISSDLPRGSSSFPSVFPRDVAHDGQKG
jgi:hypothetical protein